MLSISFSALFRGFAVASSILLTTTLVSAQRPGQPRPGYLRSSNLDNGNYRPVIASEADGSILVAESIYRSTSNGIQRFFPDYVDDLKFANHKDLDFAPDLRIGAEFQTQIYVLADSRILVCGTFSPDGQSTVPKLQILHHDGTLDPTFATDYDGVVSSVVVEGDGKFLIQGVAGEGETSTPFFLRLADDGTTEQEFSWNPDGEIAFIQPLLDGRIVVGGSFEHLNGEAAAKLAMLNSDGTTDHSFQADLVGSAGPFFPLPDGKFLVVESTVTEETTQKRLIRLNADGTRDSQFLAAPGFEVDGMIPQVGGKTIVWSTYGGHLSRLLADGSLESDSTFSGNLSTVSTIGQLLVLSNQWMLGSGVLLTTKGVGNDARALGLFYNDATVTTMSIDENRTLTFTQAGGAPEASWIAFEVLQTDSSNWESLGVPTYRDGSWVVENLPEFPVGSTIRAMTRSNANRSIEATYLSVGELSESQFALQDQGTLLTPSSELELGNVLPTFNYSKYYQLTNFNSSVYPGIVAEITGPDADDFTVDFQSGPLTPLGAKAFRIDFQPDEVGEKSAVLSLSVEGSDLPPISYVLKGTSAMVLSPQLMSNTSSIITATQSDWSSYEIGSPSLEYEPYPGLFIPIISGYSKYAFKDIDQGQEITLDYEGRSYQFIATYIGGDGNDFGLIYESPGVPVSDVSLGNFSSSVVEIAVAPDGMVYPGLDPFGSVKPGVSLMLPDGKLEMVDYSLTKRDFEGVVDPNFSASEFNFDIMTLQPDEKILGVRYDQVPRESGDGYTTVKHLQRLNPNGTVDPTFIEQDGSLVKRMGVCPDGTILVLYGNETGYPRLLGKLLSDGSLDTSFNTVTADRNIDDFVIRPDGKIILGGEFKTLNGVALKSLALLNLDGTLVEGFPSTPAKTSVRAIALQSDGKMIVAYFRVSVPDQPAICPLYRYFSDGEIDPSFQALANDYVNVISLDSDGSVLVGGDFTEISGIPVERIARLRNDPSEASFELNDSEVPELIVGGTCAAVDFVKFELSATGDSNWSPLDGECSANGNWRVIASDLPSSGLIRATWFSGLTVTGKSSSIGELYLDLGELKREFKIEHPLIDSAESIVDFGDVPDNFYHEESFVIRNTGTRSLRNVSASITGLGSEAFRVTSTDIGTLPVLGTAVLTVRFDTSVPGVHEAVLHVMAGDSSDLEVLVNLRGGAVGGEYNPHFFYPEGIPLRVGNDSGSLAGLTLGTILLDFAPEPLSVLTLVNYTTRPTEEIANLPDKGYVVIEYQGVDYTFYITYDDTGIRLSVLGTGVPVVNAFNELIVSGYQVSQAIQDVNGDIVIGGIRNDDGIYSRIQKYSMSGVLNSAFVSDRFLNVRFIASLVDGQILVGGTRWDMPSELSLFKLNGDNGSIDTAFTADTGTGYVACAAPALDGSVFLGGKFNTYNGDIYGGIVKLKSDGSVDESFKPTGTSGSVNDILPDRLGGVYVAGDFQSFNGVDCSGLIHLLRDGSIDVEFTPAYSGIFSQIAYQDSGLLISGQFTDSESNVEFHLRRITTAGEDDPSFISATADIISHFSIQGDDKIVVSGDFLKVDGVETPYICRLLPNGALDKEFSPNISYFMGGRSQIQITHLSDGSLLARANGGGVKILKGETASFDAFSPNPETLQWFPRGSGPSFSQVGFEIYAPDSTKHSVFTDLGLAHRISGGWEIATSDLSNSGQIRIKAVILNTSSSYRQFSPSNFTGRTSPIDDWRGTQFGIIQNSVSARNFSDADGDGIINLFEYGLGTNPNNPVPNKMPQWNMKDGTYEIEFDAPDLSDYTWGAEWSPNLDSEEWQDLPRLGSGNHYRFQAPVGVSSKMFVRLKFYSKD
ncbi:choice-of-anchor D domain-containing protein [Luteolibacter pohnpeiensis]|uniref:Choice-of-anchor D domain-containing protein n=1 Tax=Luteolibacter pohnpeiensis TaxID=454153 RepID=A0A934VX77_9BACT|nr:choice-of-anchor D domain-containing protein [Luteolibacter pohnpeiensis]MBK1884060.1 choice-of-anchor D domain-containing protein [Luteolibacter pohnpeiensis]